MNITPCTCHARKECGGEHDRAHLHPLDLPGEVLLPEEQGGEGDAAGAEAHETRPDRGRVENVASSSVHNTYSDLEEQLP